LGRWERGREGERERRETDDRLYHYSFRRHVGLIGRNASVRWRLWVKGGMDEGGKVELMRNLLKENCEEDQGSDLAKLLLT